MTIIEFESLELAEQEELIEMDARFIQTQLISKHLCDFYKYHDFYVMFYYLCNIDSTIHLKCLENIHGLKDFVTSFPEA